jgi:hypothetical protein
VAGLSVVALVSSASSWIALSLAQRSLESVWHDRVEALAFLHETTLPLERTVPMALTRGAEDNAVVAARVRAARVAADSAWTRYLATTLTPEEARTMRETTPAVTRAFAAADTLAAMLGADTAGVEVPVRFARAIDELAAAVERLVAIQRPITRQQVEDARARHELARAMLVASVAATFLLLIAVLATTRGGRMPWRRPTGPR